MPTRLHPARQHGLTNGRAERRAEAQERKRNSAELTCSPFQVYLELCKRASSSHGQGRSLRAARCRASGHGLAGTCLKEPRVNSKAAEFSLMLKQGGTDHPRYSKTVTRVNSRGGKIESVKLKRFPRFSIFSERLALRQRLHCVLETGGRVPRFTIFGPELVFCKFPSLHC